MGNKNWF